MKALLQILAVVMALGIASVAQTQYPERDRGYDRYSGQWQNRMSPDDQSTFNREYDKWQESSRKNDRDDIDKHARKMEEIMSRYNIPPDTPFSAIATANAGRYDVREFQGRFSPDDQKSFDKAYEHWQNSRRKNDRDDIQKDERKMQDIMARYNIPQNVPYDALASGGRGY